MCGYGCGCGGGGQEGNEKGVRQGEDAGTEEIQGYNTENTCDSSVG